MSNKTYNQQCVDSAVCVTTNCDAGACTVNICDQNNQNCGPISTDKKTCEKNYCVTTDCDSADNCTVQICRGDGTANCSTVSVNNSGSSSDNGGGSTSMDSFNTGSYVLFTCVLLFLLIGLPWIFRMYDFPSKWVVYGILALVCVALSCITTFAWQDKPEQETTRKWIMSPVLVIALIVFIFSCVELKEETLISHCGAVFFTSSILLISASFLYSFY